MKFCALTLLPFAAHAATQATDVTAASIVEDASTFQLEDNGLSVEGLPSHVFPGIIYFETDNEVVEDSSLVALIEEAFVKAANAAHNTDELRYSGVHMKEIMHEYVENTKPDDNPYNFAELGVADSVLDGADEHSGAEMELEEDPGLTIGNLVAEPVRSLGVLAEGMLGRHKHHEKKPPKEVERIVKWRWDATISSNIQCASCMPDVMASKSSSVPAPMTEEFYLTDAGRNMIIKWQHFFCNRLKKIKHLDNPDRCFIRIDFDHETFNEEEIAWFNNKN